MLLIFNNFDLRKGSNPESLEISDLVGSVVKQEVLHAADVILFHDIDKGMFNVIKCRFSIDGINRPINKHQMGIILDYILNDK